MPPDEESVPNLVSLKDSRERAIARLSDAFARDVLDVEEFERRLTLAHRASSISEIEQTVADLASALAPPARSPAPALAIRAPATATSSNVVMAIFGGVERRGSWSPPNRLTVTAVMGGILLDFRDAVFLPGVTEIHVMAVMGGVHLIVPPTLPVEVSGTAIFGGFGHAERVVAQADPGRPLLRVHGVAFCGGVAVETRLPEESEKDAHRRRRHECRGLPQSDAPRRLPAKSSR